jgi:hypothetical protein
MVFGEFSSTTTTTTTKKEREREEAVPLLATQALRGRRDIAPTHS